jgi:hypothetical protein
MVMRRNAFRRFSPLAMVLICGCATQPEFDRRAAATMPRPATAPPVLSAETVNPGTSPTRRPDLADMVAGVYDGDVISDARGSSQSNVRLTVVKSGPNTVYVTATYPRLPPFSARLTRAMNTIQNVGGPTVFLVDLSKNPPGLDVTVDDASWSGSRSD